MAKQALEGIPPYTKTAMVAKLTFVAKVTSLVVANGEKLVIFSGSIPELNEIEKLLQKVNPAPPAKLLRDMPYSLGSSIREGPWHIGKPLHGIVTRTFRW